MDFLLQQHQAKHIFRIPDGLRELCTDISREVLREQPKNIYSFIADYLEALLITRENAKVALTIVRNIMADSESIIAVLKKTGLSFEQIALAAPRLQKSFRDYLDASDINANEKESDEKPEKQSHISIGKILKEIGANFDDANRAATLIQTAFRGHYKRMNENEKNGEIQWQRAVMNTMKILKKAGISQNEATKTANLIKSAYQGYYTRRNIKLKMKEKEKKKRQSLPEPKKTIQAVAWLDMIFQDSGIKFNQANEAAFIIQKAFRKYREKKIISKNSISISSKSLIVGSILNCLNQRIFDNILDRNELSDEFETRDELSKSLEKIQIVHKSMWKKSQYSEENFYEMEEKDENEMNFTE
ncbi:uncharacterized protein LOC127277531 isoform X2 [Leptopilina boulardi]|uniref:uncharacterized protein LOC127277531 isoform X2 n=1 Tax=Leptopilina boulardi TaxID=63433 RepID=UPI0021F64F0F|nr:uncharacterized protein LOC127277531 isoform X2 [Leptopilina boulardi]